MAKAKVSFFKTYGKRRIAMDSFEQCLVFQKEVTASKLKVIEQFQKEVKQNRINVHQKLKSHGTYS